MLIFVLNILYAVILIQNKWLSLFLYFYNDLQFLLLKKASINEILQDNRACILCGI